MARLTEFERLERDLLRAERDSLKACEQRGAMELGTARGRIIATGVRWAALAKHRDRLIEKYEALGGDYSALRARAPQ
jgi:hypothetical protein